MNEFELQYKRTGKQLTYLFLMWLPFVGILMYCITRWLPRTTWLFFAIAGSYMAAATVISIRRMLAYRRWKSTRLEPF